MLRLSVQNVRQPRRPGSASSGRPCLPPGQLFAPALGHRQPSQPSRLYGMPLIPSARLVPLPRTPLSCLGGSGRAGAWVPTTSVAEPSRRWRPMPAGFRRGSRQTTLGCLGASDRIAGNGWHNGGVADPPMRDVIAAFSQAAGAELVDRGWRKRTGDLFARDFGNGTAAWLGLNRSSKHRPQVGCRTQAPLDVAARHGRHASRSRS